MHGRKVTIVEQIEAVKNCFEGKLRQSEAAKKLGVNDMTVIGWVKWYKAGGVMAFKELEHTTIYNPEIKLAAVTEYIRGEGSFRDIAAKYGLRSKSRLEN